MKKERTLKENVKLLVSYLLLVFSAIALSLVSSYCVFKIAELYSIDFITDYTFLQLFGMSLIYSLLFKINKNSKPVIDHNKYLDSAFDKIKTKMYMYALACLVALIVFNIFS
ncbi:hypothetical protein Nekkels1_15 [Cellulophaga phage Nekkels_1]|uniref:Transmembrane protein n=1 Tax=Cellulophaga phage Nekkels_1 TaxID=2745692 RepID=A0A8E4UXF0_9CAUD|nr:hypothetical protein M1M31_gp15 [Cellulophaga phage Nekkels_1]QQO97014.1 hypothetical protein Nekkels1_15 [Cellulophaga phage Nekkels_1]QQO97107.1 hypothetical protein Nekkels2_15 [Cellulophaga phage Nekkels_2]